MKTLYPVHCPHFYTAPIHGCNTPVISNRGAPFTAGIGGYKFLRNALFILPTFQMIGERYFDKEFIVMPVSPVAFFRFAFIISLV